MVGGLQPAQLNMSCIAGIGHIAIGFASARLHGDETPRVRAWLTAGACAGLAMLPDIDVLIPALYHPHGPLLDHRGLTHTPLFALCIGALVFGVGLRHLRSRRRSAQLGILAALLVASHCMLDAMAQDGRGMLFLWPLSMHRYHFPFRPLPDIPTGLQIFSQLGLRQLLIETALFLPLIADSLSWQALWRPGQINARANARPLRQRPEPSS
jgi:inner membrane protein